MLAFFIGTSDALRTVLKPKLRADYAVVKVLGCGADRLAPDLMQFEAQASSATSQYSTVAAWLTTGGKLQTGPLDVGRDYTLNLRMRPASPAGVLPDDESLLSADVPENGLQTFWSLASDAFQFKPAPYDAAAKCAMRVASPRYVASFPMLVQRGAAEPVQALQITPLEAENRTIEISIFVNGEAYQTMILEADVNRPLAEILLSGLHEVSAWTLKTRELWRHDPRTLPAARPHAASNPGTDAAERKPLFGVLTYGPRTYAPPSEAAQTEPSAGEIGRAAKPASPWIRRTIIDPPGRRDPASQTDEVRTLKALAAPIRIRDAAVIGPGGQLASVTSTLLEATGERLTFVVHPMGSAFVSIGEQPRDYVPWVVNRPALSGPVKNLYAAAEAFLSDSRAEAHLNNIDFDDLSRRLADFPQSNPPAREREESWQELKTGTALRELATYGNAVYEALLSKEARTFIENLSPRSKLQIVWPAQAGGTGLHVPWPMMYMGRVESEVDPERFLGLRFRLHYHSRTGEPPNPELGSINQFRTACLLYWGNDLIAECDCHRRAFPGMHTVFIPRSPESKPEIREVKAFLKSPSPGPVRVLYFYCKCDSTKPERPYLIFGNDLEGDYLTHADLLNLFFEDSPVIFMNACDSSAATTEMTNQIEDAFFKAGCRAYIGSEVKIPVTLSARFGATFQHFFLGNINGARIPLGDAMYHGRTFLWQSYRNIGGIFYSHSQDYLSAVNHPSGDIA